VALRVPLRQPAVFIDKDGTLVDNLPYNADPAKIRLASGAAEGLMLLRAAGFRLLLISNQPGIALGILTDSALSLAYRHLLHLLARETRMQAGSLLDGFYYCPHSPDTCKQTPGDFSSGCHCRKPAPGMLLHAAREHGLDLKRSWMIGDILDDVEAGHRAGCRSALIDNGNETEWVAGRLRTPDAVATRFDEAARLICQAGSAPRASG